MAFIIIKDKPYRFGKTRSEQESNLRKEGMATMSESELDRCKYLERKFGGNKSFFGKDEIGKVK